MKKLYLIVLTVLTAITATAQTIGDAFYIYRNDGQFNAFFCEDIVNIEYSYEDEEGIRYDEIVTQIVNTADSVYKIPLAAIDSVAFRVNDIRVSPDYLPVADGGYTIVSADVEAGQYVLLFNGSVPAIEPGSVMSIIGDGIAELIRVQSAHHSGQQVSITAEKASLGDVFAGGSFTLSTEPTASARAQSLYADGSRVFYPVEVTFYDEYNQFHCVKRNARRIGFEQSLYSYTLDYSGHEFYSNNYMKFYLQTCRLDFNLDLIISCNFNSFSEGADKWRKGELAMQKSVIRGKVDTDFMLRFDASGKKQEDLDEVMLKKNMHKPITAKFIVAGVPVVVVLNTHLLADGSYDVEGNFSAYAGFATSTSAELGCSWSQAAGLKPFASFENSFTLHDPTIEGSAHLENKVSVFPRVTFSLYGLLGPSFDIKPYVRQALDLGFYDDLITSTSKDFYGAEYNMFVGYDAAVGLSFLSVVGNEPFVKSPSWNVAEAHLYKAPQSIKFETASQETVVSGKPIDVSFRVKDALPVFDKEVNPAFPLTVKFETNSGTLSHDFSSVDTSMGLASITWTPASETNDNKDPYLVAMMHDQNGKVIAADRWTPKKGETTCPDANHPHAIDLGLPSGTKWACCNVGASAPEQYGGYYAWGETHEKSVYNEVTYSYYTGQDTDGDGWIDKNFSVVNIGSDIAGTGYDAATANWGAPWRMPSLAQIQELLNSCTSTWPTQNGVNGRKFTGPNGATVFLPAAGRRWYSDLIDAGSGGYCWSSTLYESSPYSAYLLTFGSGYVDWYGTRYFGHTVRPVRQN